MNQPEHRRQLRFLVFSASLRSDSLNTDLARLAAKTIRAEGGEVDLASMDEFDCPSYNQDVQTGHGFPDRAQEFRHRLEACDGFVISSPEYNGSMPGVLKNSIDWDRGLGSTCRVDPRHGAGTGALLVPLRA